MSGTGVDKPPLHTLSDRHGLLSILSEHLTEIEFEKPKEKDVSAEIKGCTFNNLLHGLFLVSAFSGPSSENATKLSSASSLAAFARTVQLHKILPGDTQCWVDMLDTVMVTLVSFATIEEFVDRVWMMSKILLAHLNENTTNASSTSSSSSTPSSSSSSRYTIANFDYCCLIFQGACNFMEKLVGEFNQFLSQSHVHTLTLGIECICKSIRADTIESASLVSPQHLSLEYLKERCRDIRVLLRDVYIAYTRIEAGVTHAHILTPQSTHALKNMLHSTSILAASRSPALPQIEGNWKDGTLDGTSHSIVKANKEALAKQPPIKIEIFGGASLFDLSDDEDDNEPFVPPTLTEEGELVAGESETKKHPEPRLPRGFSLFQDPRSMNIWLFDSLELARQFTLIDHAMFCAIPLSCFVTGKPMWSLPRYYRVVPEIRAFIDRFNATSLWATTAVLEGATPSERAYVFSQLVELARHLHKLHNYHSLMAIFTGLQQGAISRLKDTMACVSASDKEKFTKLQQVMSAQKNYQAYREIIQSYAVLYPQNQNSSSSSSSSISASSELSSASHNPMEAMVPHLGCHLSELATISEGNPDHLITNPHYLNLTKRQLMKKSVSVLANAQGLHYNIRPIRLIGSVINRTLRDWLRLGASTSHLEAKNLFEFSLSREPDNKPVAKGLRAMMGRYLDESGEIVVNDDIVGGEDDEDHHNNNVANHSNNNVANMSSEQLKKRQGKGGGNASQLDKTPSNRSALGAKENTNNKDIKNRGNTNNNNNNNSSNNDNNNNDDDDEDDSVDQNGDRVGGGNNKISHWKVLKAMLTPTKKKHGGIRSSIVP